ncbi:gamma-butyrobetaine dioxygenase-like [Pollicipes pollicipes]|uniref:gamma-butyrobetaine dioxygenase-like n=1 Tax=Pollicipes pollicipes TaxID=41117 RepID=UPI00188534D5|nr:gamma-butyrobetaine dioxygenase-like [Pollicipes pollicipes]
MTILVPLVDAAELVEAGEAGRCVRVQWRDGSESLYPFVWMRDNCQCSDCFLDRPTFVRALVLRDLDVDATVLECAPSADGDELHLTWAGGHQSRYAADWLLARSFRPEEQRRRLEEHTLERCHWDASLADHLPCADFQRVLESEPTRLELLVALERYGLVVVKNCGQQRDQVRRLVDTIGYPRTTHYQTIFEVRNKVDPINIAYTTKRLNMHTDLPYYEHQPQVQLLHVRRQHSGGGGRSEFTDAVHVAHQLRRLQPEAFRLLADTPVDWANVTLSQETGRSHHKLHRAPVLHVSPAGRVMGVRFSQAQRDSFFGVPLEAVERWYRAVALFNRMLNLPQFKVSFLPESGDMLVFDNTRLVHGREDYHQPEQAGERCPRGRLHRSG